MFQNEIGAVLLPSWLPGILLHDCHFVIPGVMLNAEILKETVRRSSYGCVYFKP